MWTNAPSDASVFVALTKWDDGIAERIVRRHLDPMLLAKRAGACAALSLLTLACDDPASVPGGVGGRPIVFVARTERPGGSVGDPGIYSIRADGSGLRKLTNGAGHAMTPAWSRDGSRIAFASSVNGGTELWVMNADGTGTERASPAFPGCGYDYIRITWEPSGQRLAAECLGETSIFTLANGGVASLSERLTRRVSAPSWSPDGSLLMFTENDFAPSDVHVVDPDGGAPVLLFGSAVDPAWSPDGQWIAFTRQSLGRRAVFVATDVGAEPRQITFPPELGQMDEGPSWSSDGEWLAFHRTSSLCANVGTPAEVCIPHWTVHIVRRDGAGLRKLTPDSLQATRPTW